MQTDDVDENRSQKMQAADTVHITIHNYNAETIKTAFRRFVPDTSR